MRLSAWFEEVVGAWVDWGGYGAGLGIGAAAVGRALARVGGALAFVGLVSSASLGRGAEAPAALQGAAGLSGERETASASSASGTAGFHPIGEGLWRAGGPAHWATVDARGVIRVGGSRAEQRLGVEVETAIVRRGNVALLWGKQRARLEHDGSLRVVRGGVAERIHNGARGVEQAWEFARRPTGSGGLRVGVRVREGRWQGQAEAGLRLASAEGEGAMRYGDATWVAGDGQRVPIRARWEGAMIVLRVPEAVVQGSVYPAVLDPLLGPERDLNEAVPAPSDTSGRRPAVACGAANCLVVWREQRGGETGLFGARIGLDGALLDPVGFPIGGDTLSFDGDISVAYGSKRFFVTWSAAGRYRVYGVRIDEAGQVRDNPPLLLTAPERRGENPIVVATEAGFVALWKRIDPGSGLTSRLIPWEGELGEGAPTLLLEDRTSVDWLEPVAAAHGDRITIVLTKRVSNDAWASSQSTYDAMQVDSRGERVLAGPTALVDLPVGHPYGGAGVACSAQDCLAAWRVREAGRSDLLYVSRVTASGAVVTPNGRPIFSADALYSIGLAWSEGHYLVTWEADDQIWGTRLDRTGLSLEATPLRLLSDPTSDGYEDAAPCGREGGFLVAASGPEGDYVEPVSAVMVDAAGKAGAPMVVSWSAPEQSSPDIAADEEGYLVVWEEEALPRDGVWGRYLRGVDGEPRKTAFRLQELSPDLSPTIPRVAFNGADYLTAWVTQQQGDNHLTTRRFSASWRPDVEAPRREIATQAVFGRHVEVGSASGDFLVSWLAASDYDALSIWNTPLGGTGIPAGPTVPILQLGAWHRSELALISGRSNYLLLWSADFYGVDTYDEYRVYGTIVGPDGAVVGAEAIPLSPTPGQSSTALPMGGAQLEGQYTAFWSLYSDGRDEVYATRLTEEGAVLDAVGRRLGHVYSGRDDPLAAAEHGGRILAVWPEPIEKAGYQLRAVLLDSAGEIVHQGPLGAPLPYRPRQLRLASLDGNHAVLTYVRFDPKPPYGTTRVRTRALTWAEQGTSCEADAECVSEHCVDGVCCDTPCGDGAEDCQACSVAAGAAVDGSCGLLPPDRLCRAAADPACDLAERCTGLSAQCPADLYRPDGEACGVVGACEAGSCIAGVGVETGDGREAESAGGGCEVAGRRGGEEVRPPMVMVLGLLGVGTLLRARRRWRRDMRCPPSRAGWRRL